LLLPPLPVKQGEELQYDIVLATGAGLRGVLKPPIAGATVQAVRRVRGSIVMARSTADEDGRFSFAPLPAGEYDIVALAEGREGQARCTVPGEDVTVAMNACGRIVGRVHGLDQLGPRVTWVGIRYADRREIAQLDALGRFAIEHAPLGQNVYAYLQQLAGARSEVFNVEPGQTTVVEFDAASEQAVSGVVTSARGEPISNAYVWLRPESSLDRVADVLRESRSAAWRTDAYGRFRVSRAGPSPDDRFFLVAWHEDAAPAVQRGIKVPSEGINLRLGQAHVVSGRVLWSDGSLVRAAEVRLDPFTQARHPRGRGARREDQGSDVVSFSMWDRVDGIFEFRGVAAGEYWLTVLHSDGRTASRRVQAGTQSIEVVLVQTSSIRGVVVDEKGRPIGAARITTGDRVVASTQQGRFVLRHLEPGKYTLRIEPGRASYTSEPRLSNFVATTVESVAAGTEDLIVRVALGRTVNGIVVGPDGRPVADARVTAVSAEDPSRRATSMGGRPPFAKAGPDGHFTIDGLGPGHTELRVTARGFAPRTVPATDGVEVRLARGETVRALFRLPDGKPVAQQWVRLRPKSTWLQPTGVTMGAYTDKEGRFALSGLPAGEYIIRWRFQYEGHVLPADITLPTGGETVVTLARPLTITGRVLNLEPKRRLVGRIYAHGADHTLGAADLGADGSFELHDLPPGRVILTLQLGREYVGTKLEAEAGARDVIVTPRRKDE
jgi:hypothetical protein